MDIANFGANFSIVREHLTLFAFLLFAMPLISFIGVKFWIAARANKTQRRTDWFVPGDLDSEAARLPTAWGTSLSLLRTYVATRVTQLRPGIPG